MNKPLLSQSVIFIPKPLDSGITELGLKFPAVMLDAHIAEWRPKVAKRIPSISELLIVNPVTYYLLYKNTPKSFKKLPYPHGATFEKLHSEPEFRFEKLIQSSVEYQLAKKADIIVAPYFFTEDDNSAKFNLNLTMLSETIQFLQNKNIKKPLFGMIYIGNAVLTKGLSVSNIVARYTDGEYSNAVKGYFVAIDNFDSRMEDVDSLIGLTKLIHLLAKEDKIIFAKSIGAFGEVLGAIGSSGFVDDKETMSVEYLKEKTNYGRPKNRLYIPEIFDNANDTEVQNIKYKCNCLACNGSVAKDVVSKKRHSLYRRTDAMNELSTQPSEKKVSFMKNRIDQAIDFIDYCVKNHRSLFKKTHLLKWKQVLESAEVLAKTTKNQD